MMYDVTRGIVCRAARRVGFAALATFAVPGAGSAATLVFTDATTFRTALVTSSTETFDTVPTGYYGGGGGATGTLVSGIYTITTQSLLFSGDSAYATGRNLTAQQVTPTAVNVAISSPLAAFGLNYFSTTAVTLTVNGETFAAPSTPSFPVFGFIGVITDAPISRLSFATTGNGIDFDNFISKAAPTAVPEPGTWAMSILGLGMIGAAMRYRRRLHDVAYA